MKWLKVWCVSCICILVPVGVVGHDYHLVSTAGSGRVGSLLVRYLTFGVDPCVYVQTFSPAGGINCCQIKSCVLLQERVLLRISLLLSLREAGSKATSSTWSSPLRHSALLEK
jgi:hypothetical protein